MLETFKIEPKLESFEHPFFWDIPNWRISQIAFNRRYATPCSLGYSANSCTLNLFPIASEYHFKLRTPWQQVHYNILSKKANHLLNSHYLRSCLLLWAAQAMGGTFLLEQPRSSMVLWHPRLRELMKALPKAHDAGNLVAPMWWW